jgi:hypothetical protein
MITTQILGTTQDEPLFTDVVGDIRYTVLEEDDPGFIDGTLMVCDFENNDVVVPFDQMEQGSIVVIGDFVAKVVGKVEVG